MTKRAKLLQKMRDVTGSGASFNDIVTLLEAYGFKRDRTAGSHWFFTYTDKQGKELHANFAVQNGKIVKPVYVRNICALIDEIDKGGEN